MFKSVTFNFSMPFCECKILDYGYGLSNMNGVPAFTFQCNNCVTTVMIPLPKLNGGFNFDFIPNGVKVGGKAGGESREEISDEQTKEIVERDNVIYGPWNGSDRPTNSNDVE